MVRRSAQQKRAEELGMQGDVTPLVTGAIEAFSTWRLKVKTFRLYLDWAINHDEPFPRPELELTTDLIGAMHFSPRFTLVFRSNGKLIGSDNFHVHTENWIASERINIHSGSGGVLDVPDEDLPLTQIEIFAEPFPNSFDDPLFKWNLPRRLEKKLQTAKVYDIYSLLEVDLHDIGLTPSERKRLTDDLHYLGFDESDMNLSHATHAGSHGNQRPRIIEHAVLDIVEGQETEFETEVDLVRALLALETGFRSLRIDRSLETPNRYLLIIEWQPSGDDESGFDSSPRSQQCSDLFGNYCQAIPVIERLEPVARTRGRS